MKMVKRTSRMAMWAMATIFSALTAIAQLPTATISGTVKDSSGAIIPGATITVTNPETGQSRTANAGNDGSFRFPALNVGTYDIKAEHPGFQTKVQQGLRVAVGDEKLLSISLDVGSVTESVSVTAEAPLVNTTSGSLSSLITQQTVSDLPLDGRNFNNLTLLQTGIATARTVGTEGSLDGMQFSAGGAPIRSNTFMLDGTIMNNLTSSGGSSANENSLGVEAIREYRVLTNSYSAEYGMTMGAQVSLVTKSGTNDLHGSLFEYLRNSALDARNWTDIPSKPAFRRNSFGGSLGGPIARDKAFFFLSYEGLRESRGVTLQAAVPTAAARLDGGVVPRVADVVKPYLALFPLPNGGDLGGGLGRLFSPVAQTPSEDYAQTRLDYNFSESDSLFGRWTINDPRAVDPAYASVNIPPKRREVSGRNQWVTVSENHIFSATLLNTFRGSYSRTANSRLQFGADPPGLNFVPGQAMGNLGITGLGEVGESFPLLDVKQEVLSFGDDVFYTRGRHSFKFGTLFSTNRQFVHVTTNGAGSWTFPNLAAFLEARPTSFIAITPGSRTDRDYKFKILGMYVQDDLRVNQRFNLNLGLRYEFLTEVEEVQGLGYAVRDLRVDAQATPGAPFKNPSLRNFSPRLGFAWDIFGTGTTAVRGGFGLLYDLVTFGSSFIVGATATPPISRQSRVANPVFGPLPTIPESAAGRALRTIDYHLQQPHLLSYNLALERELPFDLGLTVAYTGSRGLNLIQSKEGNPTVPQGWIEGNTCVRRATLPEFVAAGPKCWLGGEPRTNPNWADVEFKTAAGNSWYNSLQVNLVKQLKRDLQFQSAYTWSKLIDETQGQFQGPETLGGVGDDPSNRRHDRGRAEFDVRHQWRFNTLYRFPSQQSGLAGKLLNGWWSGAILIWNSGVPFVPALGTQRSRSNTQGTSGGGLRPDLVANIDAEDITRGESRGCPGVPAGTKLGTPERFYDPCAFAIPALGFLGNASRGIISGPNFSTLDFSLVKDTALSFLGDKGSLQFRTEVFNILNHPSFGITANTVGRTVYTGSADVEPARSTAGKLDSTFSKSREVQFALKLIF